MCKVPSIDSQPTWREKENKNTYGDTWHWQELLINLSPSKRSYKFGDTFQYILNLWYVGIWGAGKTEIPGQNPLRADRRTNDKLNPYVASTPGHTGGKRVLSPLHHPCSNKTKTMVCWIFPFFNSEKNYIFSLFQQKQTIMNKDWHIWLLRSLTCERSRVWVTDVTSNLYQSLSLPKWTKYDIYVRVNLLSDIIFLDDEVVTTSPVCSSKNFLSNLECTLWKSEENSQVRQKRQGHKVT